METLSGAKGTWQSQGGAVTFGGCHVPEVAWTQYTTICPLCDSPLDVQGVDLTDCHRLGQMNAEEEHQGSLGGCGGKGSGRTEGQRPVLSGWQAHDVPQSTPFGIIV